MTYPELIWRIFECIITLIVIGYMFDIIKIKINWTIGKKDK